MMLDCTVVQDVRGQNCTGYLVERAFFIMTVLTTYCTKIVSEDYTISGSLDHIMIKAALIMPK